MTDNIMENQEDESEEKELKSQQEELQDFFVKEILPLLQLFTERGKKRYILQTIFKHAR